MVALETRITTEPNPNSDRTSAVKAYSVISQRYAFLRHGMDLGYDQKALSGQIADVKQAVENHPQGRLMLYDAARKHMLKKTIYDARRTGPISRADMLGRAEANRLRNKSIEMILGFESIISPPK